MWEIRYISGTRKNPSLGEVEKADWKFRRMKTQVVQGLVGVLRFGDFLPKIREKK